MHSNVIYFIRNLGARKSVGDPWRPLANEMSTTAQQRLLPVDMNPWWPGSDH